MHVGLDIFIKGLTKFRNTREYNDFVSEHDKLELTKIDFDETTQVKEALKNSHPEIKRVGDQLFSGGFGKILLCSEDDAAKILNASPEDIVATDDREHVVVQRKELHFMIVPLN